jgi:hypothetical protein
MFIIPITSCVPVPSLHRLLVQIYYIAVPLSVAPFVGRHLFNRPSGATSSPTVLRHLLTAHLLWPPFFGRHLQLSTYLDTTTEVTALLLLLVEVEMLVAKGGEWWLLLHGGGARVRSRTTFKYLHK